MLSFIDALPAIAILGSISRTAAVYAYQTPPLLREGLVNGRLKEVKDCNERGGVGPTGI